jgi:membrane protease YdiL (CAAX protease family)
MTGTTGLALIYKFRHILSMILTAMENLVSGQVLIALLKRRKVELLANQVFIPSSIPHMVALFIYIQTLAYLLGATNPQDFKLPLIPMPIPVVIDQLFTYNGLGLVILSLCGVGIFVSRNFKQCLQRLGLVKPTAQQVGIGILIVFGSFFYDYLWSVFASGMHQDLGSKLAMYNSGTFSVMGGLVPSIILALATAICAGIGEETLTRGALQPAFGIVPAGFLHGALHGQFAHAPFFILQVAGWSCLMGIVRKYTNTSTTIIGHAGYNLVTTFLFAFNP